MSSSINPKVETREVGAQCNCKLFNLQVMNNLIHHFPTCYAYSVIN